MLPQIQLVVGVHHNGLVLQVVTVKVLGTIVSFDLVVVSTSKVAAIKSTHVRFDVCPTNVFPAKVSNLTISKRVLETYLSLFMWNPPFSEALGHFGHGHLYR